MPKTQPTPSDDGAAANPPLRSIWPVYLAAPVMLTGIQVLLPALPLMQDELDLSDAQIALVTSLYLLPSVMAAFPAGLLADRVGRRRTLTAALLLFGLGGLYLTIWHESFVVLLVVRALQGAASAAVLSLTITIIGDTASGPNQVAAQGYRSVFMKFGDAGFPVLGGVLAGIAWWAPFYAQLVTIPVAAIVWFGMAGFEEPDGGVRRGRVRAIGELLTEKAIAALQTSGFLRFFFKLALLTYLPVLADGEGAASASTIGIVLAGSAIAATIAAPLAGWLTRFVRPSTLIAASLAVIAGSLAAMALFPRLTILAAAAVVFGLADGIYGTVINAAVTQVVPASLRATFVGASAAIRNAGKFAAPTLIGVMVVVAPLRVAFGTIALLAALAIVTAVPMRSFDRQMQGVRGDGGMLEEI